MAVRSTGSPSPRSDAFFSGSFQWQRQLWLWPHLFSLDAPLIAVLWQVLLTRDLAVEVSRGEPLVLGLCVWCVYIGDRVLDAMRPRPAGWEPVRRTFYRNHLQIASIAGLCLVVMVFPLAYHLLKRSTFYAGMALTVPLLCYLALVHLAPMRWRARWPREMAVACVFTLGVFLAVWIGDGRNLRPLWIPAILLWLLCWVNCCVIEAWEWYANIHHTEGEPSRSTRWVARHFIFLAGSITCLALVVGYRNLAPLHFSIAAFLSGAALAILAACRSYLPMNGLRVAADLALCTPLLVFLFTFP
ncbi:MAG: hypothetical protein JOY85_07670 [Acidobacteriaceae bacterium]|nr:hypothetical protein [Acidobacteriaceae bacterium]